MNRSADQLDRLILRSVCDDILPFEAIVNGLREQMDADELEQLPARLLRLIALRLVDPYLLHSEPPFVTPVTTDAQGIYRHWFFISEEGLARLIQLRPPGSADSEGIAPPRKHCVRRRYGQGSGRQIGC